MCQDVQRIREGQGECLSTPAGGTIVRAYGHHFKPYGEERGLQNQTVCFPRPYTATYSNHWPTMWGWDLWSRRWIWSVQSSIYLAIHITAYDSICIIHLDQSGACVTYGLHAVCSAVLALQSCRTSWCSVSLALERARPVLQVFKDLRFNMFQLDAQGLCVARHWSSPTPSCSVYNSLCNIRI